MTLKNDRTNKGMDVELQRLFERARRLDSQSSININASETRTAFQQVAGQAGLKQNQKKRRHSWYYAAAAVFLIAAIGIGFLATPHHINTLKGKTRIISLNDGTKITLNSGSELTYHRWFGWWGRNVSIKGEAYFHVTHTGTPFVVKAGQAKITVMGTQFDVKSIPTENGYKTTVFLQKGKVKLASVDNENKVVILKPGEYSWVSEKHQIPAQPQKANLSKVTAWLRPGLSFTDQPLSAIFKEISQRFNVKIRTNPKKLAGQKLTIYLSDIENAEQAIADICMAKGWKYTKKDSTFIITRPF